MPGSIAKRVHCPLLADNGAGHRIDCPKTISAATAPVFVVGMRNNASDPGARTRRRVSHTLSYGPFLRISDRLAGWRDGRLSDAEAADARTPFVERLQATFDENDRRAVAVTQDRCRATVTALRETGDRLAVLNRRLADTVAARGALPAGPSSDELASRNGGELHLDDAAIAVRRRREHTACLGKADALIARLRAEQTDLMGAYARHIAVVTEEYGLLRIGSERMRHYYQRRLATYTRHARLADRIDPRPTINAPQWISQPCPWLPLDPDAADRVDARRVD